MIAWLNRHTSMRGRLSLTIILLLILPLILTSAWRVRVLTHEAGLNTETAGQTVQFTLDLRLEEAATGLRAWLDHGLTDLALRAARRAAGGGGAEATGARLLEFALGSGDAVGADLTEAQRLALAPWLEQCDPGQGYLAMNPLSDPAAEPTLYQLAVHPDPVRGRTVVALRDLARDVGPHGWTPPPRLSGAAHAVTLGERALPVPPEPSTDPHARHFAREQWAAFLDAGGELVGERATRERREAIAKPLHDLRGETLGLALSHADRDGLIPLAEHLPPQLQSSADRPVAAEGLRLMTVVGWIAMVGVLLAVGLGLVAPQWIWSDVRDSTDRIFGSVARLREIVARNGRALNEQVHSVRQLNESVAVLERASASIDASTRSMVDSAEQSARVSQSGNRTASVAQRAVLDVRDQVADISELMDQLGHRCREIDGILGHIDQLNEGTRKLSVNATIQAGDPSAAARQLSFVAGEMRELAEQALDSTQDIEQRIKEIRDSSDRTLDATRKGRGEVDRCLEAFEELEQAFSSILRWVDETTQFARRIEGATTSQTESLKTVSDSVSALKRRAAETEGNFRDIEDAIDELATLGEEMMEHWKVG